MKWIKAILTVLGVTLAGLWGGQKNKAVRRVGIPAIALFAGILRKKALPLVLLAVPLSAGYGENSWLIAWLGQDWLVRGVYALMLSLPFLFYGWKRWFVACVALVAAFQVRAGSLGNIWGMDILIEDIVRYGVLGLLIAFVLFRKDNPA